MRIFPPLCVWLAFIPFLGFSRVDAAAASRPNILIILADDLGYGDVSCYNREHGKIPTPHIDRLASQGLRFTDAHTSSGVCSPTRYTLLTGRYHWRSRLQQGIVQYLEAPLIAPDRLTIAGLLKQQGYHTACMGKWHLGWDWRIPEEQRTLFNPGRNKVLEATAEHRAAWEQVYSRPIAGGPTTRGFDEYFGTDVPNWPPYAYIDNDRTIGIPTTFMPAEAFKSNLLSIQGPALPGWNLDQVLPGLIDHACEHLQARAKEQQPFFLYLPLTSPHTPVAVTEEWLGKSELNSRAADFVMETDAQVGRVLQTLDDTGLAANTLVLFTSDNGPAPHLAALREKGHFSAGPLRGRKADAWEGGHRVPFIVRWPGVVAAGGQCDELVHQADLIRTVADIVDADLPDNAAEDSFSILPLLEGKPGPIRKHAVSHASSGLATLRQGSWKIIFGPEGKDKDAGCEDARLPIQLYDLSSDLGERKNLSADQPRRVADLTDLMTKLVDDGRSTPGAKQANDVPVNWRRFLPPKSP